MTRRTSVLTAAVMVSAMTLWALMPTATAQQRPPAATPGDAALAARFAELGRDALRAKTIAQPHWAASAAMLQAANRLDPADSRYPRLLVDAQLQAHDRDAAIDAIKTLLKTNPANVSAQTQLIDLYLTRMESSDAKLAYLKDIVGKPPVGDQVRAHAASRAARLLLERSENEQAALMLSQALRLNPLNLDALRMHYQLVSQTGTPLERTAAMISLLRANPAQPQIMAALAKQLSDVGLSGQALEWYYLAGALGSRMGAPPAPGFITGYIGELFIAGQVDPAGKLADQVLAANPANVDIWFLKLTIDKAAAAPTFDQTKKQAGVALSNRLAEVRAAAGQKGATTRPVSSAAGLELPDLTSDLAQFKALKDPAALRDAYIPPLADIAWYQAYYLEQPISPQLLDFLRQSLPAGNLTLARLEGWNALVQGKSDDARLKLSAVADRDPLSKLGLLRLTPKDPKSQDTANAEARKLMGDNPSGLLGAMLWGELRSNKAVTILKNPHAQAIELEVAKFPKDLLKILDTPQEFYALRGDLPQIAHPFGQPMLVNVTLQNLSDYDLTLGEGGVIHPDLWFDARLRGGVDQQVPGVAYDHIADSGVLKARQAITQTVRIDQGQLGQFLSRNPSVSVQVYTGVMTNPQAAQNGLAAGPAGYRVQFPRVMERQATSIQSDAQRQRLYNLIANGTGAEKINCIEVLATYVQLIKTNKDSTKEALTVADEMTNAIRTGMSDSDPSVQAFAAYMSALVGPPDQLPNALLQMTTDKSWQKRLLALTALPALTPEQFQSLPKNLGQDDADPVVKSYATASAAMRDIAATQPATQPSPKPLPAENK